MNRKKGMVLIGTKGVHKGHEAVYLGKGYIKIIDSYDDPINGNMKNYVGEDTKRIFVPRRAKR